MFPGMLLPGQLLPELRGTENDCDVSLALDVLHEVTLQEGVLIRDNLEKVLKKGVGRQGGEVPLQSGEDHQLHFLKDAKSLILGFRKEGKLMLTVA